MYTIDTRDQRLDERRKPERVRREAERGRDQRDRVRDRERRDDDDQLRELPERNDETEQKEQVIGAAQDVLESQRDESPRRLIPLADRSARARDRR